MNIVRRALCRVVQLGFRAVLPILPYSEPEILKSLDEVPGLLRDKGVASVLLVSDPGIKKAGLYQGLVSQLEGEGIACAVYADTCANPTIENINAAYGLYRAHSCQALIGFGGGSAMDCAKTVGARVAQPKKPVAKMGGLFKIHRRIPLLVAVPTTAGTGSEVTLAAVVNDTAHHHKYAIEDFALIPPYAVHDYRVTVGLPPQVTAATGMDALTHAVESYIGRSTDAYTRRCAEEAVRLIHDNLLTAYRDGANAEARRAMQTAAYQAGVAFTRSYVGYVHGVAHSLGGMYGVPHGLANAVALPHVLRAYGHACDRKLARLAHVAGVASEGASDAEAARVFIAWIDEMNAAMGIPQHLDCIKAADIPLMAHYCDVESNPLYPVPVLMNEHELEHLYRVVAGVPGEQEVPCGHSLVYETGALVRHVLGRA